MDVPIPAQAMILRHVPSDYLIPWQWHSVEPWIDEILKTPTTYIAGFIKRESAVAWGEKQGWLAE